MSELVLVGISHRVAAVELRERVALGERAAARVLTALCGERQISEAVAISTCNRTELYLVGDPAHAERAALEALAEHAEIDPAELARVDLHAAQLRRGAPPLPRDRRARGDGARRARDRRPGAARLRGGARARHDRPAHEPAVRRGDPDRAPRALGDGDRAQPCERVVGRRRSRPAACSATSRGARS